MAIDCTALEKKIVSTFNGTPALVSAFPGGLWGELAPENLAAGTYLIMSVLAAPSVRTYSGTDDGAISVRFQSIAIGKTTAGTAINQVLATFDDNALVLASGQCYDARRASRPTSSLYKFVDGLGNDVWSYAVEYIYAVLN